MTLISVEEPEFEETNPRRLRTAQKTLEKTDDPKLTEAARELRAIIQTMRLAPIGKAATPLSPILTLEWPSPPPAPTLEWPQ